MVRLLAERIAPRRAGLRGGAASASSSASTRGGGSDGGNINMAVLKALIKNELKQTLSIALQRCHALSLEKGANYVAGRLAQDQYHNTRQPTTATGTSHDLSHGPPQ